MFPCGSRAYCSLRTALKPSHRIISQPRPRLKPWATKPKPTEGAERIPILHSIPTMWSTEPKRHGTLVANRMSSSRSYGFSGLAPSVGFANVAHGFSPGRGCPASQVLYRTALGLSSTMNFAIEDHADCREGERRH